MEYLLITLFAMAAIYFVAYPLLSRKHAVDFEDLFNLGDARQLAYLNGKKASILENIAELDFEYEMGKLSDEDYQSLRQGYVQEAKDVVEAIDKLKVKEEIEELIEADARARRRIRDH